MVIIGERWPSRGGGEGVCREMACKNTRKTQKLQVDDVTDLSHREKREVASGTSN